MPNRSYNATGAPTFSGPGSSVVMRDEFSQIAQGFSEIEGEIDAKVFAATAPSEWVNPVRIETYISGTQFKWAGTDATGIMTPHRRVRCTVGGVFVYSEVMSSAYASGYTTVNLLDPILTSGLTLVEYAVISPLDQASGSISLVQLNQIIYAGVPAAIYTDVGGSGNQARLGVQYLGLADDGTTKMFAIVTIPV